MQAFVKFLEKIHKVHFNERNAQKYTCRPGVKLTKISNDYQTRSCMAREVWTKIGKSRSEARKAKEQPKLDNVRKLRGIYFIDPDDKEDSEIIKNARKTGKTDGSNHALQARQTAVQHLENDHNAEKC